MNLSSLPPSLSASGSATPSGVLPQLNEPERTLETIILESVATEQKQIRQDLGSLECNSVIASAKQSQSVATPLQSVSPVRSKGWAVFTSTFVTIFLAEIGDKTQLTTLLMAAQSHSPWIVFAGAGSALVTTSLLGVLLGQWLATRIAPRTLEKAAGVSLLLISVMLLWDVLH